MPVAVSAVVQLADLPSRLSTAISCQLYREQVGGGGERRTAYACSWAHLWSHCVPAAAMCVFSCRCEARRVFGAGL
jgi:hypothetical protein